MAAMNEALGEDIANTGVELEARKEVIRSKETNLANFIADLMRTEYDSDFSFVSCGSIRSNDVVPIGNFNQLTLKELWPFPGSSMVLQLTGQLIKEALEHDVSLYPGEGQFLAVSGLKFSFDPSKPAGERVNANDILLASGD